MNEWSDIFRNSGLKEMIVKDGVTGRLIYQGKKDMFNPTKENEVSK